VTDPVAVTRRLFVLLEKTENPAGTRRRASRSSGCRRDGSRIAPTSDRAADQPTGIDDTLAKHEAYGRPVV
jgi:hypothetical protein